MAKNCFDLLDKDTATTIKKDAIRLQSEYGSLNAVYTAKAGEEIAKLRDLESQILGEAKAVYEKQQPEKAQSQPVEAKVKPIENLGDKIGGSRADTATKTGPTGKTKAKDDRPAWMRRFNVAEIVAGDGKGEWVLEDTLKKNSWGHPRRLGNFQTEEEALAAIPVAAVSMKHRVISTNKDGETVYQIWRDISDRKRVMVVNKDFPDRMSAMAYMAVNAQKIIETNTTFGEADLPTPDNIRRIGVERRKGDVDGKDFMESFNFRGVEFGNWNNQIERQQLMNAAYDGLMDLAEVLGIPSKALGLNGELALAFGARGQGLSSAKAHYERDYAVINLTKMSGAGSLAHEFLHSLDHYFGRQDGKAANKWVVQADGTKVFKTKGVEDYASHGFKYKDSGVREELRAAYNHVMDTIFHKAETFVEDTEKADKFVGRAKETVAERLDRLRKNLSEQLDVRYYKRNNKPASAEQLVEFDTIAKRILDGEALETTFRFDETITKRGALKGRSTNDELEKLSAIYKAVRGRTGFTTERDGVFDKLRVEMGHYDSRLKMLASANSGEEKVKKVPTSFAMNAKELDQGRGQNYWTTPHEMAARAFQGYVEDKIKAGGGKSPFMNYAPENVGLDTPWGVKYPFPQGEERQIINKAFDGFVAALKTKEEGGKTVLYSKKAPQYDDDLSKNLPKGTVVGGADEIRDLAEQVISGELQGNEKKAIRFAIVGGEEAARIKEATGLDVVGYKHTVDVYGIRHTLSGHSDQQSESLRGQEAVNSDDFGMIPEILALPDNVSYVGTDRYGNDLIKYEKKLGGAYRYVEVVRTKRKELVIETLWKAHAREAMPGKPSQLPNVQETIGGNLPQDKKSISQPQTKASSSTVASIKSLLPNYVGNMLKAGKLQVVQSVKDLPGYLQGAANVLFAKTTDKTTYWHGSPSGDLRGGITGLHLGTKEAARQALEARIGIPAEGEWDGTREYGKTLLAGKKTQEKLKLEGRNVGTGQNASAPENDYYPTAQKYADGSIMPMDVKPNIQAFQLDTEMTNSRFRPHEDYKANGYMKANLKKGNAKRGFYYTNIGEDAGSISVVVPNGEHVRLLYSQLDGVEALYDPKNDQMFLVADMLNQDNLKPILKHELFHRALKIDPKVKAATDKFNADMQNRFNQAGKGLGSKLENEAYKRVIAAETDLEDQLEEFQAYLISAYEKSPDSLAGAVKKIIQDFIAAIRAALLRMGVALKDITPADLSALARYGAKSGINGTLGGINGNNGKLAAGGKGGQKWAMASAKAQRFYSALNRAFVNAPDKIFGNGKQLALWLQGNASKMGVKADEIYFSGILDYLNMAGKVSREGVLGYLKNGGVQVEDVVLGDQSILDKATTKAQNAYYDWNEALLIGAPEEELKRLGDISEKAESEAKKLRDSGLSSKYAQYTVPGGIEGTYQELLLTLPGNGISEEDFIKLYRQRFPKKTDIPDGDLRAWYNRGVKIPLADGEIGKTTPKYQSSHFDQPNVIAHTRFDERKDANGDKVLFVQELQSDWSADGRKEGFTQELSKADTLELENLRKQNQDLYEQIKAKVKRDEDADRLMSERSLILERIDELKKKEITGIPRAPFVEDTKAYINLLIKKLISHAVDNNIDKIAFINGEQAADLYDLSKQINMASAISNGDGTYNLILEDKNGNEIDGYSRSGKQLTPEQLEDTIGKDLSKKIIEGADRNKGKPWPKNVSVNPEFFTLRGIDLKVGGEGMKAFYDQIVPSVARDIAKRMGGEVGTVDISAKQKNMVQSKGKSLPVETIPQYALLITPAMKAKVELEGMPLFSKKNIGDTIKIDGKDRPTRNSNGQLIHQSEEGIRNFWKWFDGSKVVDDQGRPMVMYHATQSDFSEFDTGSIGTALDNGHLGTGFYFTSNDENASNYAKNLSSNTGKIGGENIIPVYLAIKNPKVLNNFAFPTTKTVTKKQADKYQTTVIYNGKDGIKFDFMSDITWFVAYDPNQIKSTIGNTGAFSPNTDNIKYSKAASLGSITNKAKDAVDFATGRDRGVLTLSDLDKMLATGKMPKEQSDMQAILDKAATLFVDASRPFDAWTRKLPFNAGKLIYAKDRAKRRTAEFEKQALDKYLHPLAKVVGKIAKTHDMEYRAAKELAGRWMTVRYALEKNQDYLRQDQRAVDEAREALAEKEAEDKKALAQGKIDIQPTNSALKTILNKAIDHQKARSEAIHEQRLIDATQEQLGAGLAGGYNDYTAQHYMDAIERKLGRPVLDEAARPVYDMLKWKLKKDLENGKVTQDMVDRWFNSPHYVPLTGDPNASEGDDPLFSHGSLNQKSDKKAVGRSGSFAINGIDAATEATQRSARYHGWVDFKDTLAETYDNLVQNEKDNGLNEREAMRAVSEQYGIDRTPETGLTRPSDSGIVVRKNGINWVYDINDTQAVDALRSLNKEDIPSLLQPLAFFTRNYSRLVTQFLPGFSLVNATRDTLEKSENIRARVLPGYEGLDMNKIGNKALKTAADPRLVKKIMGIMVEGTALEGKFKVDEKDPDTKIIREMIAEGGTSTVGNYLASTSGDLAKQMKDSLKLSTKAIDLISAWNNSFELISSYSVYKSLREAGVDKKTASAGVLNLMNFSKQGSVVRPMMALFPFINPTLQGGHQLIQTLSTKRGQARYAAYLIAGMALYTMLRAGEDDDDLGVNKMDELGNFTLERNIAIPFGDGTYLKIPVGFGLQQSAWAMAVNASKYMFGNQSATDTSVEILKSWSRTLAPVAPSETSISEHPLIWLTQTVSPQFFKPLLNVAMDVNTFGSPLTSRFEKEGVAHALQGKKSTAPEYKQIAQELSKLGYDLYPEQVKELMSGYLVGPLREIIKATIENPNKEAQGRETATQAFDRFIAKQDKSALKDSLFYRYMDKINAAAAQESLGNDLDEEEAKLARLAPIIKKLQNSANGKGAAASKALKAGQPGKAKIYRAESDAIREKAMNQVLAEMR